MRLTSKYCIQRGSTQPDDISVTASSPSRGCVYCMCQHEELGVEVRVSWEESVTCQWQTNGPVQVPVPFFTSRTTKTGKAFQRPGPTDGIRDLNRRGLICSAGKVKRPHSHNKKVARSVCTFQFSHHSKFIVQIFHEIIVPTNDRTTLYSIQFTIHSW